MSQDDDQRVSLADLAQTVDSPMIRVMGSERVDSGTHAALGAVVTYLDQLRVPA
ncbi:MAG: hypothetical protein HZB45_11045 [Mycolicibacterium rufum]|uniref:Uncharacterized protein n=1 Tax=Mycolicibacterium chlorophenolicum TaxID=37916 RepID=A0A0J6VC34_9MYCO|nr:hypothetical protein [Mycolicibacterium chlorophenolicum]KMO67287.1 hypothetical protein MCHLDSM_06536 [Mycolicibacterium chlorophenolicum]MBI5338204.1 hypothetical protein [Mycolicibacterium rufum]